MDNQMNTLKQSLGLIGLGVMGQNLALNFESHGFSVCGFDLDPGKRAQFTQRTQGLQAQCAEDLSTLVANLQIPRRVMLMVPAGQAVDEVLQQLRPLLSKGDVIIDGGNSLHSDTARRLSALQGNGILYVGTGVSGGEEGALRGPALMPGGATEAWPLVAPMLQAIAAQADDGQPCCDWMGEGGSGHFVKMVHNGIEYADMQLICEAYWLMSYMLGLTSQRMSEVFRAWNQGELGSYLIGITADILATQDPESDAALVDMILDTAEQKGTGKWTSQVALDLGVAAPTIADAVFARTLSADKNERVPPVCSSAPSHNLQAQSKIGYPKFTMPWWPRRFALMPKALHCCEPQISSTAGTCLMSASPRCGAPDASSARKCWMRCGAPLKKTRNFPTCWSMVNLVCG
jgi:6-phosphogluconate dehydrogenase